MRKILLCTFASVLLLSFFSMTNADEWDDAAKTIARLSPRSFPELTSAVADELIKMGCTIPQPDIYIHLKQRTGVITGSFAKSGQKDYAVLCSINGTSHIQIIWGGATQCKSELKFGREKGFLQGGPGPNGIVYSRAIRAVSQKSIATYQSEYGGPKPPDTSHDGIEDLFIEKGSTIFYCADGKWIKLNGAD